MTGIFVIQEEAAERYRFIWTVTHRIEIACADHLSIHYDHTASVRTLPEALEWVGRHEHEHHRAPAASTPDDAPDNSQMPAVDPACPGGPWCRCRTPHGRLKSPPCPQQGPNPYRYPPVSESTPTGPVG